MIGVAAGAAAARVKLDSSSAAPGARPCRKGRCAHMDPGLSEISVTSQDDNACKPDAAAHPDLQRDVPQQQTCNGDSRPAAAQLGSRMRFLSALPRKREVVRQVGSASQPKQQTCALCLRPLKQHSRSRTCWSCMLTSWSCCFHAFQLYCTPSCSSHPAGSPSQVGLGSFLHSSKPWKDNRQALTVCGHACRHRVLRPS